MAIGFPVKDDYVTGDVLTAANMNDLAGTLNTLSGAGSSVNKNYLINGGFAVAQRGTSFDSTGSANNDDSYTLDRWYILSDGNDVIDVSQDTTTVPTNGKFAIALDVETTNKKFGIATIIESRDVIGLVGNTVTFSFKAKVSATTKLDNVKAAIVAWSGTADTVTSDIISAWGAEGTNPSLIANATYENTPANLNLTTSYATYSVSAAVDTASTQNLILFIWSDVTDTTAGDFLYVAESKLELGSTATAFEYAGGTFQGELAACQRYYFRTTGQTTSFYTMTNMGFARNTTIAYIPFQVPVTMRKMTSLDYANIRAVRASTDVGYNTGTFTFTGNNTLNIAELAYTHGTGVFTQGENVYFGNNNSASAYIAINGEL